MATMDEHERQRYLAALHVGVLSVADPDRSGATLSLPIWYLFEPDAGVSIITAATSRKGRAIAATGRFGLVAQSEDLPYRYVSVEGPVVETRTCELERDLRPMARRYLGPELGDAYAAQWAADDTGSQVFRMRPERWFSYDSSDASLG